MRKMLRNGTFSYRGVKEEGAMEKIQTKLGDFSE
jgi:hypothetical protein